MKHLLEHLKMQLHEELDQMEAASRVANVDERRRYMYEDMLDKTKRVLHQINGTTNLNEEVNRDHPLTRSGGKGPVPTSTTPPAGFSHTVDGEQRNSFDPAGREPVNLDEHGPVDAPGAEKKQALPDALEGGKETIAEFAENYKQLTGKDLTETVAKEVLGLEDYQGSLADKIDAVSPDRDADLTEEVERVSEEDGSDLRDRFRDLADVDGNGEASGGSDDEFAGLRKSLKDLGIDVENLRDVANVDELSREEIAELVFDRVLSDVESIDDVNPRELRKLAELAENRKVARDVEDWTREGLVEWAVGERDYESFNLGRDEFTDKVKDLLQNARRTADGTIDMVDTFTNGLEDIIIEHAQEIQEEVSDNE